MKNKISKNLKGFTLIEVIVVMAVFLFIIGAAISVFLSIFQNQRRILSEQQLLNQISYAEEYISKAIRTAKVETTENCLLDSQNTDHPGYIYLLTHYDSSSDSSDPDSGKYKGIKFVSQPNDSGIGTCEEFYLDTDGILKEKKDGAAPAAITSSNLQIVSIMFAVNGDASNCNGAKPCGAAQADSAQPRITLLLNVKIPGDSAAARTIQTTISNRNLKVK